MTESQSAPHEPEIPEIPPPSPEVRRRIRWRPDKGLPVDLPEIKQPGEPTTRINPGDAPSHPGDEDEENWRDKLPPPVIH